MRVGSKEHRKEDLVMALLRRQTQAPTRRGSGFDQLAHLRNRIDRLFESPFDFASDLFSEGWMPLVDLNESNDNVIVKAELPGMKVEDIQLSLRENTLIISGERKHEEEVHEAESYRSEQISARDHFAAKRQR